MSAKTLLVVTGSRALRSDRGGSTSSEEWAIGALENRMLHGQRPSCVAHGGAPGPDQWTNDVASVSVPPIPCVIFRLDGWAYGPDGWVKRWRQHEGRALSPLERNVSLIAHAAEARDKGWDVDVLGLIAPWTKTKGTDHTLGLARKCGLKVTRAECPKEYAGVSRG
jgi:hypothetical protein